MYGIGRHWARCRRYKDEHDSPCPLNAFRLEGETYTASHTYADTYTLTYKHIHTYPYTHIFVHIHTFTQYVHACSHMHTPSVLYTHTCTHICINI